MRKIPIVYTNDLELPQIADIVISNLSLVDRTHIKYLSYQDLKSFHARYSKAIAEAIDYNLYDDKLRLVNNIKDGNETMWKLVQTMWRKLRNEDV